ncbi:MAG: MIR motif-containing protein [Monoraphidium minutum]|nr:MAG: MIR motif-containing protein [Monoraphidium minutum]
MHHVVPVLIRQDGGLARVGARGHVGERLYRRRGAPRAVPVPPTLALWLALALGPTLPRLALARGRAAARAEEPPHAPRLLVSRWGRLLHGSRTGTVLMRGQTACTICFTAVALYDRAASLWSCLCTRMAGQTPWLTRQAAERLPGQMPYTDQWPQELSGGNRALLYPLPERHALETEVLRAGVRCVQQLLGAVPRSLLRAREHRSCRSDSFVAVITLHCKSPVITAPVAEAARSAGRRAKMQLLAGTAVLVLWSLLAAQATASDLAWVTCGSTIKLAHDSSKFRLHSHQVSYSRGSQQQSVTAFPESDDANSYWVVLGSPAEPCLPGSPLKKKQKMRLQHSATRKWLHSHLFQSPLSGNQEVSAFGSDTQSDGGDVWTIDWDGKAKYWKQDTKVTLQHVDTGGFLHSLRQATFGHPIAGQHEVCAVKARNRDSEWYAAEGVYLPRADKKPKTEDGGGGGSSGGGEKDEL